MESTLDTEKLEASLNKYIEALKRGEGGEKVYMHPDRNGMVTFKISRLPNGKIDINVSEYEMQPDIMGGIHQTMREVIDFQAKKMSSVFRNVGMFSASVKFDVLQERRYETGLETLPMIDITPAPTISRKNS